MKIQSIAHSYWRLIKAGKRTFDSLSDESRNGNPPMKDQVRFLAKSDVENGVISAEQYEHYIGEPYVEEE